MFVILYLMFIIGIMNVSQDLEHNFNRTIFAAVNSYIFVSYAQPDDAS